MSFVLVFVLVLEFELVLVVFCFLELDELPEPLDELPVDLLEELPEELDELLEDDVVLLVDLDEPEEPEQAPIMHTQKIKMTTMASGPAKPPRLFLVSDMLQPFSSLPLTLRSTFPP